MPNAIQPREYSMGSGTGGALYISGSDGNLNIFKVEHDDNDLWLNGNNGNPDNFWGGHDRFVFVCPRKSLHFSPGLPREFCFCSCPFQPPSILPISSIFIDSVIYFLLSMDLVSHNIIKNILSVSTFLVAKRT